MTQEGQDVDVDSVFQAAEGVKIDEGERLRFARNILACLAIICVGVFAAYAAWPENKALSQVFELIKIGALPLVTLVVSFYFPNGTTK